MTARAMAFVGRWAGLLALLSGLAGAVSPRAAAQDAALLTPVERVMQLVVDGRNADAVEAMKAAFDSVPPVYRQVLFQFSARTCIALSDLDCAIHFASHDFIRDYKVSDGHPLTNGYLFLLASWIRFATGAYQPSDHVFRFRNGFPLALVDPTADAVLFAELHLLAAAQSRRAFDFEASRDYLDKALASVLAMQFERFDAPRLIVRIAAELLANYDAERALRLVAAAEPILGTIRADSLQNYELLQLNATLHGYRQDFAAAAQNLRQALALLDRLQLEPGRASSLRAATYNFLLGIEAVRGNRTEVRDLLQSHPLMAAKTAILQRGYFADESEFNFAVAEELVRFSLDDPTDAAWGELLKRPPRWTIDPGKIEEVQVFGQAAVGLQLMRTGTPEAIAGARREFIEAARRRLATLQQRYRQSTYASPLPFWTDQVLLQLALAATLSDATPDYELVLAAHVVLGRTFETTPDDVLANQAGQGSDDRKRAVQSLRTIGYQRAAWEKAQLAALAQRLSSSDGTIPDRIPRERFDILVTAADFAAQQRRLRAALAAKGTDAAAGLAVTLDSLKQLLHPDEALVFYAPALDRAGKICVRTDRTLSSVQQLQEADAVDVRLVRAALTAAHPPSIEADSQFPAHAAVRVRTLLFGGLDDCLRSARRVYHVAPGGMLAQIPPAALLQEVPPQMGAGFDLRNARWLVRDHSFVRTSSLGAFVASKKLSKSKRATLDYLGIGDPVLAPRTAGVPSGGTLVVRGSVQVQSGALTALDELPETSEELQRVARLFDSSRARVLRREGASEENFRLQPLSEFDVVHFATHGVIREELPGLHEPSLVLTPDLQGDAFSDGLLTASQIATLSLRARLVVMSACNSARYEASIIDSGIQGLSTAFMVAGVPAMIASLWPIESSLTRDMIVATFQAARATDRARNQASDQASDQARDQASDDVGIADALAIAMRGHLDGPSPAPLLHPRFWAALVVLGDGSMRLNAPSDRVAPSDGVARSLGPFADAGAMSGREVVSASPLDVDFVASVIGERSERFPSLVRRQAPDGMVEWQVRDPDIGAGRVVAAERVVYAAGTLVKRQGGSVVMTPSLRGLAPDGRVLWAHVLPGSPESAAVTSLAAGPGGSALALVGPGTGDPSGSGFSLIRVDAGGSIVQSAPLRSSPGSARSRHSSHLSADKHAGLAVINHHLRLMERHDRVNDLGLPNRCGEGDMADIVLFATADLRETSRTRIDRFRVRAALAMKDGWLVVGETRDGCLWETRAVAYAVTADGTVSELWRDSSPAMTSARGVRRIDDALEIVGHARWSVAVREAGREQDSPALGGPRSGTEAYLAEEVFSVRLSDEGRELARDFVAAGLPIVPLGMAAMDDRSVIFGSVGAKPLWLGR